MLKINVSRFLGTILIVASLLSFKTSNAQLGTGDIIFTGLDAQPVVNATGPRFDRVSFVALKDISVNTVIYFTDRGYKAGTWFAANGSTEGAVKLTVTTKINSGQEVLLVLTPENSGNNYYSATVEGSSIGTLVQHVSKLSLGSPGDQLFAYYSSNGEPNGSDAVMISGLHWNVYQTGTTGNFTLFTNDAGWDNLTSAALASTNSNIPPGLVAGESAFWLGSIVNTTTGSNGYVEAAAFNGKDKPYGNAAQIRSLVMDRANWNRVLSGNGTAVQVPTTHFTSVLPVDLIKFSAQLNTSGFLKVNWETASEVNNSHFILESSLDGKVWKSLARKEAARTGATGASYEIETNIGTISLAGFGLLGVLLLPFSNRRFRMLGAFFILALFAVSCARDKGLEEIGIGSGDSSKNTTIYLRLAQVDLDGTVSYSEILQVKSK